MDISPMQIMMLSRPIFAINPSEVLAYDLFHVRFEGGQGPSKVHSQASVQQALLFVHVGIANTVSHFLFTMGVTRELTQCLQWAIAMQRIVARSIARMFVTDRHAGLPGKCPAARRKKRMAFQTSAHAICRACFNAFESSRQLRSVPNICVAHFVKRDPEKMHLK